MNDKTQNKQRLAALRKAMEEEGVDGFLVPRADEWLGEFVAPYAERLNWLTGFTGSAGMAVVLKDRAVLLTDSRYTIQAAQQLDPKLYAREDITEISPAEWIAANAGKKAVIGYDPWLHPQEQLNKMAEKKILLCPVGINLIDTVWKGQPGRPATTIHNFPDEIAGDPASQKCAQVSWFLKEAGITWFILTLPDSIAWLLNIRASDVEYIPQALSYLAISDSGEIIWFVEPSRVSAPVKSKLKDKAEIIHPDKMQARLEKLAAQKGRVVFGVDFKRSPSWFRWFLEDVQGAKVLDVKDPCLFPKSLKTFQEQQAIRKAHVTDGVAVVRFLKWLEEAVEDMEDLSEISVADKLEYFRSLSPVYCGPSFATIAGYGANGAIVHYRATEASDAAIMPGNLLLLDSGGQYHYGTTDITRTIAIGEPTKEMRENFTRVLQGHIAVASAHFADGTTGKDIDALARKPLKKAGLDYGHGTGHGVGCFLAVHEHAANLSPRGEDPVKPGMLLSNEPGYYKEGEYGIRIENLILCTFENDADAPVLKPPSYMFETVTRAPIDLKLVEVKMLTKNERAWLNGYHAAVYETLAPLLDEDEQEWLEAATQEI